MTTLAANESPVQHAKAGSVTVKIYRGHNRGQPMFTVAWMVGERRFRRNFADEKRAVRFAKTQAKELSAGRVDASCISTTEAAEYREAQRRLREKAPIHVAAGEYASAVERLGEAGSLAQAVEFFLHNSMRPDMTALSPRSSRSSSRRSRRTDSARPTLTMPRGGSGGLPPTSRRTLLTSPLATWTNGWWR